MEGLF